LKKLSFDWYETDIRESLPSRRENPTSWTQAPIVRTQLFPKPSQYCLAVRSSALPERGLE
ncbi:MAG: hypothetical protein ACXV3D_01705, partial [Halobacteriota archaeon]